MNAAEEAGKLILNLPKLWVEANLEEKRKLLLTMLDAVYVDAKKYKSIIAIKPKPPFKPIFQVAVSKAGSEIRIINEPYEGSSVFLVETGRLGLPLKHGCALPEKSIKTEYIQTVLKQAYHRYPFQSWHYSYFHPLQCLLTPGMGSTKSLA